jgi:uncharacterized membrane protein YgaE (UPF0421/DUF939 family)
MEVDNEMTNSHWAMISWLVGNILAFVIAVSLAHSFGFSIGVAFFAAMTVLIDIRAKLGTFK